MLDLKNLGVVEMSSQEVIETEGGFWWIVALWALCAAAYTALVIVPRMD